MEMEIGSWDEALGTENWQLRTEATSITASCVFCLILNLAKFISHSLHARVPQLCPLAHRAASGRMYELSHVAAAMLRGKLKVGFNFSRRQRRAVNNAITHPRCNLLIKIFNWLFTYIFWRRRRC